MVPTLLINFLSIVTTITAITAINSLVTYPRGGIGTVTTVADVYRNMKLDGQIEWTTNCGPSLRPGVPVPYTGSTVIHVIWVIGYKL
jgi:hypothetical protein